MLNHESFLKFVALQVAFWILMCWSLKHKPMDFCFGMAITAGIVTVIFSFVYCLDLWKARKNK